MNDQNPINPNTKESSIFDKITLPLAIIIAGVLIGAGFWIGGRAKVNTPSTPAPSSARDISSSASLKQSLRPIDANDHVLGNANARIVIVEYSDPECPFCKNFHSTMKRIMQDYGKDGKVAWVYRHYPIDELHKKSFKESIAMECAAALGSESSFWEYANKLYEITPSNDGLDPLELPKIASAVNVPTDKFNTCLTAGEFDARVSADIQNAKELGILGTPYSILIDTKTQDYYPLEGAYPYDQLKTAIDLILQS